MIKKLLMMFNYFLKIVWVYKERVYVREWMEKRICGVERVWVWELKFISNARFTGSPRKPANPPGTPMVSKSR